MTDGNTYAINKRLDDQEDYDAMQEVTAELEQAEARIEELEAKLSESEALLAKAVEAERERCAQVAENVATCILPSGHFLSERVAIAIRESTGGDDE